MKLHSYFIFINTAQPRVYQYFVAWHEVYHLVYDSNLPDEMHNITVDMKMNERKADYFAASVLLGNVYEYYHALEDEDFTNRIIRCMDLYKAPYKAVLIHLFEKAVTLYNDLQLKELILEHFDHKPDDKVKTQYPPLSQSYIMEITWRYVFSTTT